MGLATAIVSQKGGVGKSTLARLVAREYAAHGWRVQIADGGLPQTSCVRWQARRQAGDLRQAVGVEPFRNIDEIESRKQRFDLVVLDSPPHSTAGTLRMAAADLVVLPTGLALDDLEIGVLLAHELVKEGILKSRLAYARSGWAVATPKLSKPSIICEGAGYCVLAGSIPERTAYRRASDAGRSLTETTFDSLNQGVDKLVQAINKLHKG